MLNTTFVKILLQRKRASVNLDSSLLPKICDAKWSHTIITRLRTLLVEHAPIFCSVTYCLCSAHAYSFVYFSGNYDWTHQSMSCNLCFFHSFYLLFLEQSFIAQILLSSMQWQGLYLRIVWGNCDIQHFCHICYGWLYHLLPKFEHIFVAVITFPPFFCADSFTLSLLLIVCALRWYVKCLYRHLLLEDISKHARVTQKNSASKLEHV